MMKKYLFLILLTLLFWKWTSPVVGCDKKTDCENKDLGTEFILVIVIVPIGLGIIIAFCSGICCKISSVAAYFDKRRELDCELGSYGDGGDCDAGGDCDCGDGGD